MRGRTEEASGRDGRLWRFLSIGVAVSLTAFVIAVNALLHVPSTSLAPRSSEREGEVVAQLRFLEDAIGRGAARDMQRIYPEGFFFQHVLTGLAWCDLAKESADAGLKREASAAARKALAAIESKEGTRIFPEEIVPKYGVFWTAWTSLLRGKIVALDGPKTDSALFLRWRAGLDDIASAYAGKENPYQPSYVEMAWSGDNVMAMLALASHDRLLDTARYQGTMRKWVAQVRTTLDPNTGTPPFELEHPSGRVVRSTRGSSQTLFAWAMTEIDTSFAREQYQQLRKHFFATRLGLPVVLEYPPDSAGMADYDSGPVIWGVGASATIVTLATARKFGDSAFAQALESTIRFFGVPVRFNGRTAFAFRQMPVGDAWIAWARTSTPVQGVRMDEWPVSPRWTWIIHGLSIGCVLAMWGIVWLVWRRGRIVRTEPGESDDESLVN